MKLSGSLLGVLSVDAKIFHSEQFNGTSPDLPFLGNDIRYTKEQISAFEDSGVDTDGMIETPETNRQGTRKWKTKEGKAIVTDDHSYHRRWTNPSGYSGTNLRVPYRFASGEFTTSEQTTIKTSMDNMSDLVLGCIEFYDDTTTQLYDRGYVRFQSSSGGCWAQVGYVGHHSSYQTHQPINLSKSGCIHDMIITHEFLHALGVFHEQSRPDRDNFIIVHYENIQSAYHSQYNKMNVGDWVDQSVKYDYLSVMHYPSYGFATGSQPTMTHITTGDPVQKPRRTRVSTLDMIQLQLMYPEFCPQPVPTATCADGNDVYLLPFACDGISDCEDGSDEIESACNQVCADKLIVSVGDAVEPKPDALGVYAYTGTIFNNKQQYKHEWKEWYMYVSAENQNWHITAEAGAEWAQYYSPPANCPYGTGQPWYYAVDETNWAVFDTMKVEVFVQQDFCGRDNPCDETFETCVNSATSAVCTFNAEACPVGNGTLTTWEDCVEAICPDTLKVEGTEPDAAETVLGTYEYQGIRNKRPAYKRNDGNRYIKGDEWIVYDFDQKRWTISEVFNAGDMSVFNQTFEEIAYQESELLWATTHGNDAAPWMKSSNDLSVGSDFSIGNGNTACDDGTHGCAAGEMCVPDLATTAFECVANPCQADTCPGLGHSCSFDANVCPPEEDNEGTPQVRIWHGEEDVATWKFIGGYRTYHGDFYAMFDDKYDNRNMYHSSACEEERGVVINFVTPVTYVDLQIYTRSHCCRDRYMGVCLYADGVKVSCTPDNLGDPGMTVNFADYNLPAAATVGPTSEFRLMWDDIENSGCAQIEELFFHYVDSSVSTIPSKGRKLGTIEKWGEQFQLEFDVNIMNKQTALSNLVHFWAYDGEIDKAVRIPQIQVQPDSTKLKVGSYINGATKWVESAGLTGWNHVVVKQNYDLEGKSIYRVSVGGKTLIREENSSPAIYTDVVAYLSSPWSNAAINAEIKNIELSEAIIPCGPTCTFDKDNCPKANVHWKGTKVSSLLYGATGAAQLRLTIYNNDKTTVDIRKSRYTGFMMFAKSKCGNDFLKATTDGRVKFQFYDKGYGVNTLYEQNFVYYRSGKKASSTIQFRQKKKSQTPPVDLPPKNLKRDQLLLGITGLDTVENLSYEKCFGTGGILVGVMADGEANQGKTDWTECVAWQKSRK